MGILKKFIALRPFHVRDHIMQKFNLKDTVMINIQHPGTDVCDIKFNSLGLERSFEGIYFEGVAVDIAVKPKHDYEFVGWENNKSTSTELQIVPEGDLALVPIIKPKKKSPFADSIIFNEISYYQPEGDTTGDWLELYNNSLKSLDISGWGFSDKSFKKRFVIPEGTEVASKGYLVLTENLIKFRGLYSADSIVAIGDFDFGLSSKGELLKLYDKEGLMVDSLTFKESIANPDSAFTLALCHPDSSIAGIEVWAHESPSPSYGNKAYLDYLQNEADKKYWTNVFYVGGGSFFFILVGGLLFYRYSRKKK